MNRRNVMAGVSLAALVSVAGCAVTPAQAAANATKIVQVSQAGLTTLTAELKIFGVTLTGAALTAYNALSAGVTGLSGVAVTDATAIATFATAPTSNLAQLLTDAGTLILAALRVLPGTSSAVGLVQDVIAAAPLVTTFAQLILTPAAASASSTGAMQAAARLGVVL